MPCRTAPKPRSPAFLDHSTDTAPSLPSSSVDFLASTPCRLPRWQRQRGDPPHDEAHAREQLPEVELDLGHHPPRFGPTRRLIEETLVPDHRLVAWSSHWPRQQLRDIPLQAVVGRDADGLFHAPLLQRLVDLRLGEGRVGTKHHLFAQLLTQQVGQRKLRVFAPAGVVKCCAMSSPKIRRSSNSRTTIRPPSELTRDPWESIFREVLKES